MSTMISNLKTPYYYCLNTYSIHGITFYIGWEYPKNHIDIHWDIDKTNFKLVE